MEGYRRRDRNAYKKVARISKEEINVNVGKSDGMMTDRRVVYVLAEGEKTVETEKKSRPI